MPKTNTHTPGRAAHARRAIRLAANADIREANRKRDALIAAAPELLAACKRVLRAIVWTTTAERMTPTEQADVLREAILKAGGAP